MPSAFFCDQMPEAHRAAVKASLEKKKQDATRKRSSTGAKGSNFTRESVRLSSFCTWPSFSKVLPVDLAKAGFYYKGPLEGWALDTVICPFCHLKVTEWADDDVPAKEHAGLSPACPFVTGSDLGIRDVGFRAWRRKSRSRGGERSLKRRRSL